MNTKLRSGFHVTCFYIEYGETIKYSILFSHQWPLANLYSS